jgi:type IV secretory pathway VirB3-like protein
MVMGVSVRAMGVDKMVVVVVVVVREAGDMAVCTVMHN